MRTLRCSRIIYFSQLDEALFFDALSKISGIQKFEGIGPDLILTTRSRLSNRSLQELIGLFTRYRIEMRQLSQYSTKQNESWFRDPEKFWYKRVFRNEKLA